MAMSLIETRGYQMFPVLEAGQIETAKRFASGPARNFAPGEIIFDVGERHAPSWLVLEGSIDIMRRDGLNREAAITTHHAGQFSGELSQLGGRASLASGRAGDQGCTALPFDGVHIRALMIGSAEIGEIMMRAFILRRVGLIEESEKGAHVGSVLVGTPGNPDLSRIEGFLARNGYPYTVLDPAKDPEARVQLDRAGITAEDLPVMFCPNGQVLRRPNESEAAACLGLMPDLDLDKLYDVAVVGAGPAGLAAAVYAASEGLSVMVFDTRAFGGQAGASQRIENYFGFPTGINGMKLTARGFNQALKFGAEVAIPLSVEKLDCGGQLTRACHSLKLDLDNGKALRARTVVIASGARYRRLPIANLSDFEGAGVSFWATSVERKRCEDQEVALVGGGNSAGQAVVFLAERVKHLHLVIRRGGLEATMSKYLIERINALPNVTLCTDTEVVGLEGEAHKQLTAATFRNRKTGEEKRCELNHLFLFCGADPNTDWLDGCVAVDSKGFVTTGGSFDARTCDGNRPVLPLETSWPGVFAIGDVRAGSTKRVAAAVGEGAAVVAQIHNVLDVN
jgi:thioredoxin reductase (NADPH)